MDILVVFLGAAATFTASLLVFATWAWDTWLDVMLERLVKLNPDQGRAQLQKFALHAWRSHVLRLAIASLVLWVTFWVSVSFATNA